jgi:hypothetical protein
MAIDAVRLVPQVRHLGEKFDRTTAHYAIHYVSEDGVFETYHIYGAGAPSTDFNDAPLGSMYTDTTNYKLYIMTAAATWTVVGAQS